MEELFPVIAEDGRVTYLTTSDIEKNGFIVKNDEVRITNEEFNDLNDGE